VNLRCRCETCCTALAANTGRKKVTKKSPSGTIAQLCRAISSQLRHVSTIWKKPIKQQYLLHMFPQYGELRPTSGWDRSGSLRVPLQISTAFASWQRKCTALQYWASAKLCCVEQRAPPIFGRAAITLGICPHSSSTCSSLLFCLFICLCLILLLHCSRIFCAFVCKTQWNIQCAAKKQGYWLLRLKNVPNISQLLMNLGWRDVTYLWSQYDLHFVWQHHHTVCN